MRLEGFGQLKNSMTSGIEPATFRLVVWCPIFNPNFVDILRLVSLITEFLIVLSAQLQIYSKVIPVLEHHAIKTYGEVEAQFHIFQI
jgi:hypothetical protein